MRTSPCVVDASVLVAATRPSEPFHVDAQACLQNLTSNRISLLVPNIALAEMAAALSRSGAEARLAVRVVEAYRQNPDFLVVPVDDTLADGAVIVASYQRIRGCDAVYVALAEQRAAILITLDNEQRLRTPSTVLAQTPREILAQLSSS